MLKGKTLLGLAGLVVMLTSCGGGNTSVPAGDSGDSGLSGKATNGGKVLNIWSINTELQTRVRDYYTLWEKTDSNGDDILRNGVRIKWHIVANEGNAYQIALDAALTQNDNASADDKIDVFLAEAGYITKYAQTDYSLDVEKDIGLTDNDLSGMFEYTKTLSKDEDGNIKGTSWQATPGVFAYRRDIAQEVWGQSDPDFVQVKMSDWDKFETASADLKAKNYYTLSSSSDLSLPYANGRTTPWVTDGVVHVDDVMHAWADTSKEFYANQWSHGTSMWSPDWLADASPSGKVFGYFSAPWLINFTLQPQSLADPSAPLAIGNGTFGKWGAIKGPETFSNGGSWLLAAKGTDNQVEIKRLMEDLTCSRNIASRITRDTDDFTNNKDAMAALANDSDYGSAFLGGENVTKLYYENVQKINSDDSLMGPYDQGCNEQFPIAMQDYIIGDITYEQGLEAFKTRLSALYPALSFDF